MKRHHAILIFSAGAFFFGLNPLFLNLGYASGWSLSEINVVQAGIALAVLWTVGAIALMRRPHIIKKLTLETILRLIIAGSFTGLTSVLYYASMQYVPASLAIVLLFQFVWIGVLLEWIFYRRKPTGKTMITVVLTLIGVVFAADLFNGGFSEINLTGFLFGIGSAFTYSAFILLSGRVATDLPATIRSPIMITGAAFLIFIIFPPAEVVHTGLFTDASIWIYAGALSLCGLVLTPLMFAISAPHLPASLATLLGAIELPVSIAVAYIGLGEYITPGRWFGVSLIIAAIMIGEMRGIWAVVFRRERYVN